MSHRWRWIAVAQYAGAALLGAVILPVVAQKVDTTECETVVHVMDAGVVVWIDGMAYRIDDQRDSPIVCQLPPGHHTLRMTREDRIVFEETFTIEPDREAVLTAWDEGRRSAAQSNPAPVESFDLP